MDEVSALTLADRYASLAEEATENGLFAKALEAHQKAAGK